MSASSITVPSSTGTAALPMLAAGTPMSKVSRHVGDDTTSAFVAALRRETGTTPAADFRDVTAWICGAALRGTFASGVRAEPVAQDREHLVDGGPGVQLLRGHARGADE